MIPLTFLPLRVRIFLQTMPEFFHYGHQLIFSWLIVIQIVYSGKKTLKGMARFCPKHIAEYHFRRLLCAGYWSIHILLYWFARSVINSLPAAEDGVIYLATDTSKKDKRGKKNPVAKKGKISAHHSYHFGIHFVVLLLCWDVYRIPVDFEIVRRKDDPKYQKENELFREMISRFTPPSWTKRIIVLADAAFASKENLKTILKFNKEKKYSCHWNFVFSIARTWKFENNKSLSNLVKHLPKSSYKKIWIPSLEKNRRHVFFVFTKTARLNHIGEVTIVLSKTRRNIGPKKTKILVTNLTNVTARSVVSIYKKRWSVEILFKELKSGLGLGEHQVTKKFDRVEKSIGIPIISYLLLLKMRKQDIKPGKPWSIFQLIHNFSLDVTTKQIEHSTRSKLKKDLKLNMLA
jgi:hypothetical protein